MLEDSESVGVSLSGAGLGNISPASETPSKKVKRTKEDIAREKEAYVRQVALSIASIVAEYHRRLPRSCADATGAIYARYSTRFQDSIEDQVRALLDIAAKEKIFVPLENVFYDLAAKGYQQRRPGLLEMQQAAEQRKFSVLLVFATNRLFRKQFLSLKFVEEQVEAGIRCIFPSSGIDTGKGEDWRTMLQLLGIIDERGGSMYAEHVRAGHIGLFTNRMVHGSLPLGFRGEAVPGAYTKRKRARQVIVVDKQASRYIQQIFRWFGEDHVSLVDIARRLNEDSASPPPAKSTTSLWTAELVRLHLRNCRYRGEWAYGRRQSRWSLRKDRRVSEIRPEPLKSQHFEELRIVSEELWLRVQSRLGEQSRHSGRRPKDGDRKRRPRLLNDIFVCPRHKHLTVGGPFGAQAFCKLCAEEPSHQRFLFSHLNRQMALRITCDAITQFINEDTDLIAKVIEACGHEVARLAKPDDQEHARILARIGKITRTLDFLRDNPGDYEEDQKETTRRIRELSNERLSLRQDLLRAEQNRNVVLKAPTSEEVRALLRSLGDILTRATSGECDESTCEAKAIINAVTGGRIELHQMGQRSRKKGWLQGRFRLRVVEAAIERLTGLTVVGYGCEVAIDFNDDHERIAKSQKAWELYLQGCSNAEIGMAVGLKKAAVLRLLKMAAEANNISLEGPAERSRRVRAFTSSSAMYREIAESVHREWEAGNSLREIGRRHQCTDTTAKKALIFWCESLGLATPRLASRSDVQDAEMWCSLCGGESIADIAERHQMARRTVTLRLKKYCQRQGIPWTDRRTLAGRRSKNG